MPFLFCTSILCGQGIVPPPPSPVCAEMYGIVETMPRFPGCEEVEKSTDQRKCSEVALLAYVDSTLVYPLGLNTLSGRVMTVVSFTINKDGYVINPRIARDPGFGTGDAALRVIEEMMADSIRWTPGKMGGRAVPVQFNLPVRFGSALGGEKENDNK